VTLFPEAFPGTLGLSPDREGAGRWGVWALETIDLRPFGEGRHRNVDDTPAGGGGAGMVLRADVVARALDAGDAVAHSALTGRAGPWSSCRPRGRPFDPGDGAAAGRRPRGMTLLCGRFEGVDERVLEAYGIEEISLGDFVMTGGEIAAQAMLDATVRLIAGRSGQHAASTEEESFSVGVAGISAIYSADGLGGARDSGGAACRAIMARLRNGAGPRRNG
jgi:tRNA (guanine37-N1)-methyltransferase